MCWPRPLLPRPLAPLAPLSPVWHVAWVAVSRHWHWGSSWHWRRPRHLAPLHAGAQAHAGAAPPVARVLDAVGGRGADLGLVNNPLAPAGDHRRPGLVVQPVSDPGLVGPHLNLCCHVEVASVAVEVTLADKLAQLAGLHDVKAGGSAVIAAVEMYLGHSEGGDGHVTQAAVLLFPQPELGVVVGVDVLVQLRVGDQLPLQQPQVSSVPVPAQVLLQLGLRAAVSLTNLKNGNRERTRTFKICRVPRSRSPCGEEDWVLQSRPAQQLRWQARRRTGPPSPCACWT